MARRRRRYSDRDDAFAVSSAPLRSPLIEKLLKAPRLPSSRSYLQELEDRREFTPELYRPARASVRSAARLEVAHDRNVNRSRQKVRPNKLLVPDNLRFSDPSRVALCVRRHQRREVLHATKRVGRGSSVKPPRWSEFSSIRCK